MNKLDQVLESTYTKLDSKVIDEFIERSKNFISLLPENFIEVQVLIERYDPYELYNYLDLQEEQTQWILLIKNLCFTRLGYNLKVDNLKVDDNLYNQYTNIENKVPVHWVVIDYINSYFTEAFYNNLEKRFNPDFCDQAVEMKDRVLADIKRIPKFVDDQKAALEIGIIYQKLDYLCSVFNIDLAENDYTEETIYWFSQTDELLRILSVDDGYGDSLKHIQVDFLEKTINKVREYYKLKEEHEELKRSYEELKKVKEMDFNDIVSNGVGNFLN